MLDDRAVLGDLGDCGGDHLLVDGIGRRHVDVETVGANHVVLVVVELIADHDDRMHRPVGVDDAMPRAERPVGTADLVERRGDLHVVVGMLVR